MAVPNTWRNFSAVSLAVLQKVFIFLIRSGLLHARDLLSPNFFRNLLLGTWKRRTLPGSC